MTLANSRQGIHVMELKLVLYLHLLKSMPPGVRREAIVQRKRYKKRNYLTKSSTVLLPLGVSHKCGWDRALCIQGSVSKRAQTIYDYGFSTSLVNTNWFYAWGLLVEGSKRTGHQR